MHVFPLAVARRLCYTLVACAMAATSLLAGVNGASALELDRNFVLRHGSVVDLQIHDARQRRDAFQQGQARFREVDRIRAAEHERRPKIPRLPRNCLPAPIGVNALGACR